MKSAVCISCRRRRINGSDARVSSRDRAVTSRKQVRGEVSVLSNLTSSCCQGRRRRRGAEARRRGTGRQLMSVWDSGTDCPHHHLHRDRLTTSFTGLDPTALVDDRGFLCHHHHHHHDLCGQQQQPLSIDDHQGHITPLSFLRLRIILHYITFTTIKDTLHRCQTVNFHSNASVTDPDLE